MKRNILIVEDNKNLCELMSEILNECDVTVAVDGIYGLKIAKIKIPDIVIIDLNLPRMNGHEMIRKIKEDPKLKNMVLVVISGTFNQLYVGEKVQGIDADAVFSKPLEMPKFKQWIETVPLPSRE
ncbi:MAG: hypothetical protein A2268_09510 [Candidatus Raymondbacteria bacterium RifOxyA12_full_50_37]|uniref:Response regulatory domain-containing protein n=1 Tax=Candidatus Raymondbacteria bacterium RIFOXYD12_FULL_49_13 TaxID=1817890 RepID=A0A1F7F1D0_UNCRA|nr:MAG: hypothetical protein A2268_09510 [Candidatus Raymondbacteria bacterium RifOxyA12_full_50_37]OGJ93127.1 MAG: hypothetical protein A2350_17700 [Candidatus Raymondbacteria bacterium RifOxyB12_full_50_8]OGJ93923.1 MAG: hypothetical protein A2248_06785 [Candidatus Raymondbacteria bacterium RIFOXYA2_FULL_49_16]OGJ98208.1 MAG: hypothetical protein A2453_00380 [Candidatus Raymondbacteria bacterium RIFOXYC2_FULL_50_21]OGK00441.1 MAG: hypothetical protein A2519_10555 [Candidatus Raymondbacteria b